MRVTLTRLDGGIAAANELNVFSDTMAYPGQSKNLAIGCYLIRHGDDYLLWDAGLPAEMKGKPIDPKPAIDATLAVTLEEQLATLGLDTASIKYVGLSHYHFDHVGQLPQFAHATLLIGARDWAAITAKPPQAHADPAPFEPWISGGGRVELAQPDKDVFGDGTVVMIGLPGHTPGHCGLLVRLANTGPVLLTGDATHFRENYETDGVPTFNVDRAETLASLDRLKSIAANLNATVIIQHEPADIAKLPAFPAAAE